MSSSLPNRRSSVVKSLLSLCLVGAALSMAAAGDAPKALPKNPARDEVLSHLLKLTPADAWAC